MRLWGHSKAGPETEPLSEDDQKSIALELILNAWEKAQSEGCEPELIATSAIFAALTDMVDRYGEGPVADMAATLAERIRSGEFSMRDVDPH